MIKTEDFMEPTGARSVGEIGFKNLNAEKKALSALVDAFAEEMKKKLHKKHDEGWNGWDNPELAEPIHNKLIEHSSRDIETNDMVDVANLAAMLWNFKQSS